MSWPLLVLHQDHPQLCKPTRALPGCKEQHLWRGKATLAQFTFPNSHRIPIEKQGPQKLTCSFITHVLHPPHTCSIRHTLHQSQPHSSHHVHAPASFGRTGTSPIPCKGAGDVQGMPRVAFPLFHLCSSLRAPSQCYPSTPNNSSALSEELRLIWSVPNTFHHHSPP